MKIKLIIPWLMLSFLVFAQETSIVPQTQGDVSFVSGGVGGDERDAMQAIRDDYNLSLLFSVTGSGEYLSEVNVTIKDAGGKTVLETVSDGPMLFAKLKPGRYAISADSEGQVIEKSVTVKDKLGARVSFTWSR